MAKRKQASAERTLLCAVKFWSGYGSPTSPFYKKLASATRRTVRAVARGAGGFSKQEIDQAETDLIYNGYLKVAGLPGRRALELTGKGKRRSCKTVSLSPYTDPQYPGSRLEGAGWLNRRGGRCSYTVKWKDNGKTLVLYDSRGRSRNLIRFTGEKMSSKERRLFEDTLMDKRCRRSH